jgi:hypothetical protein
MCVEVLSLRGSGCLSERYQKLCVGTVVLDMRLGAIDDQSEYALARYALFRVFGRFAFACGGKLFERFDSRAAADHFWFFLK